jgi:hypothetical protein
MSDMQLKLPKQILDWVMSEKGETSPQAFIIDQLFLLKQTANKNEGVNYDTKERSDTSTS